MCMVDDSASKVSSGFALAFTVSTSIGCCLWIFFAPIPARGFVAFLGANMVGPLDLVGLSVVPAWLSSCTFRSVPENSMVPLFRSSVPASCTKSEAY